MKLQHTLYKTGVYHALPGARFLEAAKEVLAATKSDTQLVFNDISINVYTESCIHDLCEKYDTRVALRMARQ